MYNINNLFSPDRIIFLNQSDKLQAITGLANVLDTSPFVTDPAVFLQAVIARENVLSTGIGVQIAMPHAKIASVTDVAIAVGISKEGIDWNSIDGKPVHIVMLTCANESQSSQYLHVLAAIVRKLKNENRRQAILFANDIKRIYEILLMEAE